MYFHCIDDYFSDYNHRRRSQLGQAFGPSLAGGGLAFLLEGSQEASCMQVAAGSVISGTKELHIVSHIDCGAYRYFAGIDWRDHDLDVQVATLWRDLYAAEKIVHRFLQAFDHPFDHDWTPPELSIHLDVINLSEEQISAPASLEQALPSSLYRGIRLPF